MVASHAPPTEDLARNPGMCPDWKSNRQPFGLQVGTQSTEPHHQGLKYIRKETEALQERTHSKILQGMKIK